jgi:hypothetical protein
LKSSQIRRLLRTFVLEMLIYAALVVGYFFLVLRLLAEPLARLFDSNLVLYAILGLALIVAQGVVLEMVTSLIVGFWGLNKSE